MRTAAGATHAMTEAHQLLRAAGLTVGELAYPGPEIEMLRRDYWPQSLARLHDAVRHAAAA